MDKAQTKWGLQSARASGISNSNKNTDTYINFKELEKHYVHSYLQYKSILATAA